MDSNLFDAAGLPLPPLPPKKRAKAPRPPTPAERAASGRLEGARRSRSPLRHRVGPGRDRPPAIAADVVPFPLSRNAKVLAAMTARLPDGHADNLEDVFAYERSKYARCLIARGLPKKTAQQCANELFHQAYMIRATEAGIL